METRRQHIHGSWTEVRAVWNRGAQATCERLSQIERAFPFVFKKLDFDNGSEFLNAHIEQKNYTHVRLWLGDACFSILRSNRADSSTLRSTIQILRRRFQIPDAVFLFESGMSSKINLQFLDDEGLEFVPHLSNSTLETLLKDLPGETQLELTDAHRLIEIEHNG